MQAQIQGSYDPEIGFTVSFTHVEESAYFDCRVPDNEDIFVQFHVIVNENCESNNCSSNETSFSSNPSTIDVSTTVSPETVQLELLERLEKFLSGDGVTNKNSKGVCFRKEADLLVAAAFSFSLLCFGFSSVWVPLLLSITF